MSNSKTAATRKSAEWKHMARLFYDFEGGEVFPFAGASGTSDVAIQMGICARLFQNGFEEDASIVWQRMVSHDIGLQAHSESSHKPPVSNDLSQQIDSAGKQKENVEQYSPLQMRHTPQESSSAAKETRESVKWLSERQNAMQLSEVDLFGTESSKGRMLTAKDDNLLTEL